MKRKEAGAVSEAKENTTHTVKIKPYAPAHSICQLACFTLEIQIPV